ncbi:MAG: DUF262 domain-containing protein [Alphaproteobacteria bacterium]|nr:MAG: DUF262 domain-containing protein [Alphaproteobacteria bacterium]
MNYPADTTLQGYQEMWDRGELSVPEFQREFIWDQVKASKLIESFLLGLPVPGVFLFKERESSKYLIIDGQQRITSIVSFLKGVIHDRVFRLKNVDRRWEGRTFKELSESDRFTLTGRVLRATIIQQISPDDKTSIYHIFERLNTGGVNLNPMEIRQCVSYGPFVQVLKDMNEDASWRKLIGKDNIDKRLRDVELILRCLALSINADNYEKPMKGFLNKYMERERANPSDYEQLKTNFSNTCTEIISCLGEKPFNLRGRLNYGLLDSILATALRLGVPKDLDVDLNELLKNEEFLDAITKNTSDLSEVECRMRLASEAFAS